jgi:hypothetical protein
MGQMEGSIYGLTQNKVKLPLQKAVEAHRMVRRRDSHIYYKIGSQMAVKLSTLNVGRPLHHQEDSWYSFLLEAESSTEPQYG